MSRRLISAVLTSAVAVAAALTAGAGTAHAAGAQLYVAPTQIGTHDCLSAANACDIDAISAALTDGATVNFANGEYDESGAVTIAHSVALAAEPGATPVIEGTGGPGTDALVIAGGVTVTINGLYIINGGGTSTTAINVANSTVTVTASRISTSGTGITAANSTVNFTDAQCACNMIGFALFGNSHATVTNSTILGASDVGISQNSGTLSLTITNSSILNNDSGGIDLEGDSATVTIASSTLANGDGNGLYDGDTDGTVTVRNSTVADNGGAGLESVAPMTVTGSTIVGNEVIGLRNDVGTLTIGADVIADNQIGDCRAPTTVDLGFNIDSLTSVGTSSPCRLTSPTSVAASTTIADSLEPLGSNGGPTETVALKPDSPAIGLVTGLLTDGSPICGTSDQRGVARHATTCDAGASEAGAPKQATVSLAVGASGGTTVGGTTTVAATVVGSGGTTPTGTISFTAGGVPFGTTCSNLALHGSGSTATATCQAKLPVGTYQLRASYSGDATYQAGADTISSYPVNKATTSTTAKAVKKAKHGKKVKISVTTKHSGGTGHPTGHVVIYDNGKKIHTVTEKSTGKITTTVKITKGRNYIQAVYGGNSVFTGSTGARVITGT